MFSNNLPCCRIFFNLGENGENIPWFFSNLSSSFKITVWISSILQDNKSIFISIKFFKWSIKKDLPLPHSPFIPIIEK